MPSDRSIIAWAPARAAAGPVSNGGSGARYMLRASAMIPIDSSSRIAGSMCSPSNRSKPACEKPTRPLTAITSPGFAPERTTGSPSHQPMTVIDSTIFSPADISPPTTPAPTSRARSPIPRTKSISHSTSVSGVSTTEITIDDVYPPIPAISARFCAVIRAPIW
ncbi:Uncharacterised protein [Chlamydia trachomatis]|nr:Uncharacterised protein [Chlamydia trachomatis]